MDNTLPSESSLLAELALTFPGLHKRPLREFGKNYAAMIGVWTGGPGDMPDGLPIFNSTEFGGAYDGHIHKEFLAWLERRGWYVENHDEATFLIIPIAYAMEE